ncbi:hypothetical protein [Bradyrhizobium sp. CCBAU 45389]|uniref:hypothetical protein n=1 Tax=Bradyrhizobium sp. CCBAU 45389 TaxID=858429 RepID=UPI002305B4F9|nr:hypothetical protein [Bradyrhizobium sp. CCBAU 45389]
MTFGANLLAGVLPPFPDLDSFPIILGHLKQALPLKVKGSDGGVFSASPFEPAEFL